MLNLRGRAYILRKALSTRATRQASWRDIWLPADGERLERHLDETIRWLCHAQDVTQDGGVSYGFDVKQNCWLPPYPETTGYIIPTFLEYARMCGWRMIDSELQALRERARRMAHWLTTVQLACGALPGGTVAIAPEPTVFNTGQVLQGWCRAYREFDDTSLRHCLVRAARWLVSVQDADGCWRRFLSPLTVKTPATYNVRTAAALLEAGELLNDANCCRAAVRSFDWALTQQRENGWFANNCLTDNDCPLTHTIGYTLEGLLDAAITLRSERYLSAVVRAANQLLHSVRADGFLSGRFDAQWRPQVSWNCLTGTCQIARVWFRLGYALSEERYRRVATRVLSFVKSTQRLSTTCNADGVCGGIKGSYPIWGGYEPFIYPNWAAKFFADAVLAAEAAP